MTAGSVPLLSCRFPAWLGSELGTGDLMAVATSVPGLATPLARWKVLGSRRGQGQARGQAPRAGVRALLGSRGKARTGGSGAVSSRQGA